MVRTPWSQIDDVFYEARGSTWALLHFLRAIDASPNGVLLLDADDHITWCSAAA